jgi:hypothetical protein
MTTPALLTNDEYHRRIDRTDKRARRVYSKAIGLMKQHLGAGEKISRLHALELAAGALESGARAFGIARPWPHAAAQLRRLHADLKATIEHAKMMQEHNPSSPDIKSLAGIDTVELAIATPTPRQED